MKISTTNLIGTEIFLKLLQSTGRLTTDGHELLSLVQDEIVRRAIDSIAEYKFVSRYKQLKHYDKLPVKKGKKKAHKIMIPYKARKIRLCKDKGLLSKRLLPLNGRRKK